MNSVEFGKISNFSNYVLERCRARADEMFLVYDDVNHYIEITYSDFYYYVLNAAKYLRERHVKTGDHVLIYLDNQPELIIFSFACAHIGAIAIVGNCRSNKTELDYLLGDSDPSLIVTNPSYADLFSGKSDLYSLCVYTQIEVSEQSGCFLLTEEDLYDLSSTGHFPPVEVNALFPALVFYTSGTTSPAKGVVITHGLIQWAAESNASNLDLSTQDSVLLFLPLYHVLAFSFEMLATLASGGKVVMHKVFNPVQFWKSAKKHNCTWASSLPYIQHALSNFPIPDDHNFKFWAPAVKHPVIEEMFGIPTVGWWGMTELFSFGCLGDVKGHSDPAYSIGRFTKTGNDFKLLNTFEVKVNDGYMAGELVVKGERGKTIFLEYLNKPKESIECFTDDGWFITGDQVLLDESGNVFFDTRLKDIIKVGGENVSALEIEGVIYASGLVKEAAVVGRPDDMYTEVPVAFVIAKDPAMDSEFISNQLLKLSREYLSELKVLHDVHVVIELPRAQMGKVAKNKLRETFREN